MNYELEPRWRLLSWLVVGVLVGYLAIVLPLDKAFPIINRWYVAAILILILGGLTYGALRWLVWRRPSAEELTKNITLFSAMLLISLLTADVGLRVFYNVTPSIRHFNVPDSERMVDAHVWDGELLPEIYYPTDNNFYLYKPGQRKSAMVFGPEYYPALSSHAILRKFVLEQRFNDFIIDEYGLRNTDDPANARIFALGDSFCFGYQTGQQAVFTSLMKRHLKEPVYNVGVSGTSPLQQYLLLDYLLRTHPNTFKPRKLLWLIFEGNDLEDSYDFKSPYLPTGLSPHRIFEGTMVYSIAKIPAVLRQQSAIRLLTSGEITLGSLTRRSGGNHDEPVGRLHSPLYHSPRFGYRFFLRPYLHWGSQPQSYVLNHPNLPKLRTTFQLMKELAAERKFEVSVVIVPSAARLYKDHFDDLSAISEQPHLINYLIELSNENGFAYVDLNTQLAPYAEKELLYYRDDSHWNERGNQIVAELLVQHLGALRLGNDGTNATGSAVERRSGP